MKGEMIALSQLEGLDLNVGRWMEISIKIETSFKGEIAKPFDIININVFI